jgi:hypothetical protein
LILIEGSGGRGVVGDGIGGGPPAELRWVPVDVRRGTGLPASSPNISALLGVISAAEDAPSLAGLIAAASRSSSKPDPALIGLINGEVGYPPNPSSLEEPAKKEELSLRTDFGFGNRLFRVKVVRRGARSVSRSVLRASRETGVWGVSSTVDFEAQDRRSMDPAEDAIHSGENRVRRWYVRRGLKSNKLTIVRPQ